MLILHLSLRPVSTPRDNWHLLIPPTFLEKEKWMRQPWCLWVASLLLYGSCGSVQLPHLYYAGSLLCIRWRQTPQSTTSCTQHTACLMPHTQHASKKKGSFFRNIKLILGWEGTLTSFLNPPCGLSWFYLQAVFVLMYFWQCGGSVVCAVGC